MEKPEFKISKLDEEQRRVFGWASISIQTDGETVTDLQKDQIEPTDLEEAAYGFNLNFRKTGVMHEGPARGDLIESLVVTPEKLEALGLEKSALPMGWFVGFQVDDETFQKVKNGHLKMFSIQGRAKRVEVS